MRAEDILSRLTGCLQWGRKMVSAEGIEKVQIGGSSFCPSRAESCSDKSKLHTLSPGSTEALNST